MSNDTVYMPSNFKAFFTSSKIIAKVCLYSCITLGVIIVITPDSEFNETTRLVAFVNWIGVAFCLFLGLTATLALVDVFCGRGPLKVISVDDSGIASYFLSWNGAKSDYKKMIWSDVAKVIVQVYNTNETRRFVFVSFAEETIELDDLYDLKSFVAHFHSARKRHGIRMVTEPLRTIDFSAKLATVGGLLTAALLGLLLGELGGFESMLRIIDVTHVVSRRLRRRTHVAGRRLGRRDLLRP